MSWKDDVDRELRLARQAVKEGNHGKARTCARRAVGHAAGELQRIVGTPHLGNDMMSQVRGIAASEEFSRNVREAADRLQSRISQDFASPSEDPVSDAGMIIAEIADRIVAGQDRSSKR